MKLVKDAADPEFEDTDQIDNLKVILANEQGTPEEQVSKLVSDQADQKLMMEGLITKTKETSVKLVQNTDSLNSVRETVESVSEKLSETPEEVVLKMEKSTLITSLGKKINVLTETVHSLQDKIALIPSPGLANETVKEFDDVKKKPNWGKGPIDLLGHRDWSLKEFLEQPEGHSLYKLLWTMSVPDVNEWNELVAWWDFQKTRWSKGHANNLLPWYRAVSWWASQFLNTWQGLLTDYMANPLNLSLQEICYKVAMVRNILHSMGFLSSNTARLKWVEPFNHMGNRHTRSLGSVFSKKTYFSTFA